MAVKFYSVYERKTIMVPESKTTKITKKGKNRTVKMLVGVDSKGRKVYKITG